MTIDTLNSFLQFDPTTKEALNKLNHNTRFQQLWDGVMKKWGDKLSISPYTPKTLEQYNVKAWTDYDQMGMGLPTKITISYNGELSLSQKSFFILLELCNVERMDDYIQLDKDITTLYPNSYALKREEIEWEVTKKAHEISKEFSPPLTYPQNNITADFNQYLQMTKTTGHFQNYERLGTWLLIKKTFFNLFTYL